DRPAGGDRGAHRGGPPAAAPPARERRMTAAREKSRGLTVLAALLALPLALACGGGPDAARGARRLNVYIWTNYLPPGAVSDFERRSGVRIEVDTYSSNEALLEKLQSGVADYDLVVPSDYMLQVLV